jgi:hypothetical protein
MEGDTRIISSKDILSSEFYEIDMMAVRLAARWGEDTKYRIGYTVMVRQLRRILHHDIKKRKEDSEDDYSVPNTKDYHVDSFGDWDGLHINLTDLAREIGMVGRETAPWGDSLLNIKKKDGIHENSV